MKALPTPSGALTGFWAAVIVMLLIVSALPYFLGPGGDAARARARELASLSEDRGAGGGTGAGRNGSELFARC
jgi:hypothetical protein